MVMCERKQESLPNIPDPMSPPVQRSYDGVILRWCWTTFGGFGDLGEHHSIFVRPAPMQECVNSGLAHSILDACCRLNRVGGGGVALGERKSCRQRSKLMGPVNPPGVEIHMEVASDTSRVQPSVLSP